MRKNRILLTPAEVAKELKLNLLTIYKYIRRGDLGAIKLGRTYRVARRKNINGALIWNLTTYDDKFYSITPSGDENRRILLDWTSNW